MKILGNNFLLLLLLFLAFSSCKEKTYTPKPMGYRRIDFPEKNYTRFDTSCPFTFEYPVYGKIAYDQSASAEPCWFNIVFPEYNGKIHISYKKVRGNLPELIEDARKFVYKHTVKADAIQEKNYMQAPDKVYGILYELKGNVASSVQFFVTDSSEHFVRGALYFETTPNKDSLAPVVDFFEKDVVHFMETFHWK